MNGEIYTFDTGISSTGVDVYSKHGYSNQAYINTNTYNQIINYIYKIYI